MVGPDSFSLLLQSSERDCNGVESIKGDFRQIGLLQGKKFVYIPSIQVDSLKTVQSAFGALEY
jgi:hypothetical protein